VHDDLPCFDDAALRRGQPTVCRAFGEPLAVLAGDALIVLAFETVARAGLAAPDRLPAVLRALCRGAGAADGIVAGQALELDPRTPREEYHRLKTGALFVAALTAGAVAGGGDPAAWEPLGRAIGAAYQIADDLGDALSDAAHLGKPAGQDAALDRPSAVRDLGVAGALEALAGRLSEALAVIPAGPLEPVLRQLVTDPVLRFLPPTVTLPLAG
jgi:geranylgeranyl diphosphate synthase type II